jgi:uncharacterized protein (TIGR02453 family)
MFTGFPRKGLRFLEQLAAHNERAWFTPRKTEYERDLLEPMRAFVVDASAAMRAARIPIGGSERRSIFRVYRDVRFSPDKSPYRTNVASYLSYDGERGTPGGLYVQVAPSDSRLSIAFYKLERPMLQRWRSEMARSPARFRSVLRKLRASNVELGEPEDWDDSLTRMPRGFERYASSDLAPYFRLRSFCARRRVTLRDVTSPVLVRRAVEFARDAKPLLEYGWSLD